MPRNLPASPLLENAPAPLEALRRAEALLNALAALPKKSWRPRPDARGVKAAGPGLARAARLLDILGVPGARQEIVHVVGTSGKGSTALMMAEALLASGRRTAAFFSPHLTSIVERFWIGGRFAEPALIARCARELAEAAERMAKEPEFGPPSFFEAALGLFLVMAREEDCECLVLEAGLGGTFDATNAAGAAVLDVITSVGLDHTELLGDSIARIARDKAGIITEGGRVMPGAVPPEARAEIERAAFERGARLYAPPRLENADLRPDGALFDVTFDDGARWESLSTSMPGAHQAQNAALAAGACRLLGLGEREIRAGVAAARLPCRMERVQSNPQVVLDGAHNRDKARALAAGLARRESGRLIFVLGAVGGKDFRGMAEAFAAAGDSFFVTLPPVGAPRAALSPVAFARALEAAGAARVEIRMDAWAALDDALAEAGEKDWVATAGSMFLAGELRRRWVSEARIAESGLAFPHEARP